MRVDRVANFINRSKTTQKILRSVNNNAALFSAGISFVAASFLRPSAVLVLPIKDKKDKAYTIGASVSAGLVELALAGLLFIPLNKGISKTASKLYDSGNTIFSKNNLLLRDYKNINNRLFKLGTLPATAFARFALISPLVKLLFKKDKKVVGVDTKA